MITISRQHAALAQTTTGSASSAGGRKRVLILGGTGFLGPAVVEAAKARGHSITLFNRGKTEKRIGLIDGVEKLYGNRDPNLPADETKDDKGEFANPHPKGLESLQGKTWDAVIDTSGYVPRIVKASAELLAPNVKQYIFISTISVYADNSKPNADESDGLLTMEDPTNENVAENYGALKALCERVAEAAMPGRTTVVRPALIVGPGDPTDRFTYWPVRIAKGAEVLAPGSPDDPVQMIDVRDLAEWLVLMVENGTKGIFNGNNPAPGKLTIGQTLDACKQAARSDAKFVWANADFLEQQHVAAWSDMPLWLPPVGEMAGAHLRSNARAVAVGLKWRGVQETAAAILAWWPNELERRKRITAQLMEESRAIDRDKSKFADPSKLRAGIDPEREREVLEAWHEKTGA